MLGQEWYCVRELWLTYMKTGVFICWSWAPVTSCFVHALEVYIGRTPEVYPERKAAMYPTVYDTLPLLEGEFLE